MNEIFVTEVKDENGNILGRIFGSECEKSDVETVRRMWELDEKIRNDHPEYFSPILK